MNQARAKKAYLFFKRHIGQTLGLQILSEHIGWRLSTCKTYQSKGYWQPYIKHHCQTREITVSEAFSTLSEDKFLQLHSQKRQDDKEDVDNQSS